MILNDVKLDGKKGVGQAMALALAEAGADIVGLDRGESQSTQDMVRSLDRKYHPVVCDLRAASVDQLHQVVEGVVSEMGGLDILVNNAGIIRRAPALEFSEADWDDVLQINLKAVFFLSQAAARVMAQQGHGKIINIASMLSFQGGILVPSYTAAKSGVAGLTRALANEWAKHGINVNAIAPGYMVTDINASLRADPQRNQPILARIPAGRWGDAADL